jgi:hypothetical protein
MIPKAMLDQKARDIEKVKTQRVCENRETSSKNAPERTDSVRLCIIIFWLFPRCSQRKRRRSTIFEENQATRNIVAGCLCIEDESTLW